MNTHAHPGTFLTSCLLSTHEPVVEEVLLVFAGLGIPAWIMLSVFMPETKGLSLKSYGA
jgi:hypothetical protein